MASLNLVCLIGNMTRDAQIKYLPNGTAVADIGLAINQRIKRGNEWVDSAVFVDVTCFGKTAEAVGQYTQKGSSLNVLGRLQLDTWDDKQTGQKRSKLKVVAESVQFLGTKPSGEQRQSEPQPEPVGASTGGDEETPF